MLATSMNVLFPPANNQVLTARQLDYHPSTCVRLHAGANSCITFGWTKSNTDWTNVGWLWCYQWTFHEPQKMDGWEKRAEIVRSQLPHKYECVYAWNEKKLYMRQTCCKYECVHVCSTSLYNLCTCMCSLYSVYMCIQLYSAKGLNDVAFNKK